MKVSRPTTIVRFESNGRVSIPPSVCRRFGIREGTKATIVATDAGILLRPVTRAYIHSLRGKHRNLPLFEALSEGRKHERAH